MYRPDMEAYVDLFSVAHPQVLTIGWLAKDKPFTKGKIETELTEKLKLLTKSKATANFYRGNPYCRLCDADFRPDAGLGEIWIPYTDKMVFAAPTYIYHYVDAHKYLPPQKFIDAVMQVDMNSDWNGELVSAAIMSKHRPILIEATAYVLLRKQGWEKEDLPPLKVNEPEKFHQLPEAKEIIQRIRKYKDQFC